MSMSDSMGNLENGKALGLKWPITGAIRALAMDGVEAAKSGHPGAPMGMAEISAVLWRNHLQHNPANPDFINRDRFVLSNGHGSMLIYALLHLTGYNLPIEELKRFRQLHSKTPGHPERHITKGVETTTGPLGQGFANAVGMAIAEKTLAAQFNRPKLEVINHRTYVFLGDGCLMEGVSHEVASLAGRLNLNKLIAFYDDNNISIDGQVGEWFADDTPKRFAAYGWNVIPHVDGHDPVAVNAAVEAAKKSKDKPTLICCKTIIGKGSPNKQNHQDAHGAPLGAEEIARTKEIMGWPHPAFHVPADVYAAWDGKAKGTALEAEWNALYASYEAKHPKLAAELQRRLKGDLSKGFMKAANKAFADILAAGETIATRKASQNALKVFAPVVPEFLGGSADLVHSNLTNYPGSTPITRDPAGNQIFYGVREFGMSAIANGIALHGGFIPFVATFLVFSDYARNAIRMSALMGQRVIYVFTHDSIGLGEDGPTHQPIEHVESLRLIPNLDVWRPSDAAETLLAWESALQRQEGPTALILSRQNLPQQIKEAKQKSAASHGAVVLYQSKERVKATLVATGSEVKIAMAAAKTLSNEGIGTRVVSLSCVEAFERMSLDAQNKIIPARLPVITIEAGSTRGWHKLAGRNGAVMGINRFGESAPEKDLFPFFGLTEEKLVALVKTTFAK